MARVKAEKPLTEAELMVLLAERFAAPEYAFMPHVRNGTGYTRRTTRTADALAMSLWPSRGLDLHGFEIKSDRADWIREKENPEKAEEIARFCDRWWVVAGGENVVHQDDLFPPTWGLLVASGGKLRVVREAPKLEAQPLDRPMMAAILRRAAETVIPKPQIEAELERARQQGEERDRRDAEAEASGERHAHERLRDAVAAFEAASGVEIPTWRAGRVGEAVQFVLNGGVEAAEERLRALHAGARELAAALEAQVARLTQPERKAG
jgi:hypothetical protein